MRPLTDSQLKEIDKIVGEHMSVLLGVFGGGKRLSNKRLEALGLDPKAPGFLEQAYALGKLRQTKGDDFFDGLDYDALIDALKQTQLTASEKDELDYARRMAGRHITNAERKITLAVDDTNTRIGRRTMMEKEVAGRTVADAVLKRQTRGELVSALGHATEEWTRDWERVANTELWDARLSATTRQILKGDTIYSSLKGREARVYRRPAPDACRHCKRLYLEADGITPKIFLLHELIANGDNVGVKVADWKPTVHPTHPHCSCPMEAVPDGFIFDEYGDLVPE